MKTLINNSCVTVKIIASTLLISVGVTFSVVPAAESMYSYDSHDTDLEKVKLISDEDRAEVRDRCYATLSGYLSQVTDITKVIEGFNKVLPEFFLKNVPKNKKKMLLSCLNSVHQHIKKYYLTTRESSLTVSSSIVKANNKDINQALCLQQSLVSDRMLETFNDLAAKEVINFNKNVYQKGFKSFFVNTIYLRPPTYTKMFDWTKKCAQQVNEEIVMPWLKNVSVCRQSMCEKFGRLDEVLQVIDKMTFTLLIAQAYSELAKAFSEQVCTDGSLAVCLVPGIEKAKVSFIKFKIGGFATSGIAIGSVLGPIGAAVGAAVGTAIGVSDSARAYNLFRKSLQVYSMVPANHLAVLCLTKAFDLLNMLQTKISAAKIAQIKADMSAKESAFTLREEQNDAKITGLEERIKINQDQLVQTNKDKELYSEEIRSLKNLLKQNQQQLKQNKEQHHLEMAELQRKNQEKIDSMEEKGAVVVRSLSQKIRKVEDERDKNDAHVQQQLAMVTSVLQNIVQNNPNLLPQISASSDQDQASSSLPLVLFSQSNSQD